MRLKVADTVRNDLYRVEMLEPHTVAWTLFFKIDGPLSMRLSKPRGEIVISPVMMHSRWMSSDFNNQYSLESAALRNGYCRRILTRDADALIIESVS